MTNEFPDDMTQRVRLTLENDLFVYGCAYYEETETEYERISPRKATSHQRPDAVVGTGGVSGTSLVDHVEVLRRVSDRRDWWQHD